MRILFIFLTFLFFKDFIYLLLERGEGTEKEKERNSSVQEIYQLVASHTPSPNWGIWPATQAHACPDWESNLQPFGLKASAQSTEPHQPGKDIIY